LLPSEVICVQLRHGAKVKVPTVAIPSTVYSRVREKPCRARVFTDSRKSVSQKLSLGGVGVPLGTGVLFLAQTTWRETIT